MNYKLYSRGISNVQDGVSVRYLPIVARYHHKVTFSPTVFKESARLMQTVDLVHIFGMYDLLAPVAARAARRASIPYLLEPLGMYRPIVRSLRKKRLYHALIGRTFAERAARLIATSELEREDLLTLGVDETRIEVRPNGVDLEEFRNLPMRGAFRGRYGIASVAPLVLFLGRLTARKRPDLVVQALAMLRTPDTHAAFVGPDEDGTRAVLEQMANSLGIRHRVLFPGPLYETNRLEALVDADVLVLPSEEGENFANVALEAAACRLPVVVSDRCGIAPQINNRAGYAVPPDASHLAEKIGYVLTDTRAREVLANSGPTFAAEYSWENVVPQMEKIYSSVLKDWSDPSSTHR